MIGWTYRYGQMSIQTTHRVATQRAQSEQFGALGKGIKAVMIKQRTNTRLSLGTGVGHPGKQNGQTYIMMFLGVQGKFL